MTLVVKAGGQPMKRIPRERPKTGWVCSCGVEHKPYIASCSRCRDARS
jgi:hypothetical protein